MKVVCIKDYLSTGLHAPNRQELTYGKVYDVINIRDILGEDVYWIINDIGYKEYYTYSQFLSLEEWREKQLNELGI